MKKKFLLGSVLLLFCFMQTFAQQRTITGTVIASDGSPLSGASVMVVGQRTGETTASDGSFSINVPEKTKNLRISYIGYVTKDVSVSGQSLITVSLQTEATNLNEIVVTGYTSQLKKDITGSVATVNVNDAKKIPATSSEQLLQGQASGVTVINSGAPGAAATRLRDRHDRTQGWWRGASLACPRSGRATSPHRATASLCSRRARVSQIHRRRNAATQSAAHARSQEILLSRCVCSSRRPR